MTALYMFLAAVCVLGPLVALHEFGHYIVARLCGVKVLTYSIGFGPKILGWTSRRSGIDYRISLIPLGGYVKMLDEREAPVEPDLQAKAFNRQHPLKKIAIVAAGPVMNFLIAIGLFWVLFLLPSEQLNTRIGKVLTPSPAQTAGLVVGDKIIAIDQKPVQTWEEINYALANRMGETGSVGVTIEKMNTNAQNTLSVPIERFMQQSDNPDPMQVSPLSELGIMPFEPAIAPIIGEVVPDGAAAMMGLKAGDKIISIDGVVINDWRDATKIIRENPNEFLMMAIERNGQNLTIKVMPKSVKTKQGNIGQLGVKVAFDPNTAIDPAYRMTIKHMPMQALEQSFAKTYDLAAMTLSSMGKMLTGLIGVEHISGPITIAEVSKTSFEIGWQQVLSTAALISLSLAVLNLLPIPVLDGGHLVFYTYELLVGKPMPEAVQMGALKVGMILLLCFMVLAMSNDIIRIFG